MWHYHVENGLKRATTGGNKHHKTGCKNGVKALESKENKGIASPWLFSVAAMMERGDSGVIHMEVFMNSMRPM